MELWQILALISAMSAGVFGILQKIEVESSFNRNGFVFYSHLGYSIIPFLLWLTGSITFDHNASLFFIALLTNLLYVTIFKFRLYCLKYMTTSSYFINYKILTSIFLIAVGQIFFSENISVNEYLGIGIGFITFFLLLEKPDGKKRIEKYKIGVLYLTISVIISGILWTINKIVAIEDFDIMTYIFYSGGIGCSYAIILKGKDSVKDVLEIQSKKHLLFLLTGMVVFFAGFLCNVLALSYGGDISVVFKIASYALFGPIIFSIIYYKEKVTLKILIAFILTIISIGLFV